MLSHVEMLTFISKCDIILKKSERHLKTKEIKMFNYQKIYKKCYRKMPKIIFITLVAVLGLIAIIDLLASSKFFIKPYSGLLSFIVGSKAISSFIFALFLWAIFTGVIAGLVSFQVACFISARIVMIDAIIQVSTKLDSIVDKKENKEVL